MLINFIYCFMTVCTICAINNKEFLCSKSAVILTRPCFIDKTLLLKHEGCMHIYSIPSYHHNLLTSVNFYADGMMYQCI